MPYKFKISVHTEAAFNRVMAAYGNMGRGETISWEDFDRVAELDHRKYPSVYNRFIEYVHSERSVLVIVARGVGLYFTTPSEHASIPPVRRFKKIKNQGKKLLHETERVDVSQLSDHQLRVLAQDRLNAAMLTRQAESAKRVHVELSKPTEALPRP